MYRAKRRLYHENTLRDIRDYEKLYRCRIDRFRTGVNMKAKARFDNTKRRRPDGHARQAMLTPQYLLEQVRALLGGFDLDPCTEPDNPTGAHRFYSLPRDGCSAPWDAVRIWCNPPYGEARERWVDRCIAESDGRKIALLIPAHPDTRTFQKAMRSCTSMLFTKGRLKFGVLRENGRQEAASHGSALFGFNIDLSPLYHLGVVVRPVKPQLDLFAEAP